MDDLLHLFNGKIFFVGLVKIDEHFVHHDEFPIEEFALEVNWPKDFFDGFDWVLVLVNVIDFSGLFLKSIIPVFVVGFAPEFLLP